MTTPAYQPTPPSNPIGCVTSWIGRLFRPPTPAYVAPESPKATPIVARVRGVVMTPAYGADGTTGDPATGDGVTLVVDDDETANLVLEAIHAGATVNVLSVARCR